MSDDLHRDLSLQLTKEVADLRERINASANEAKEYALQRSEKARNTAIGVFSFVALVLAIIAYLGLDGVVKAELEALGSEEILQQAKDAAGTAEELSQQVSARAAELEEIAARYTALYENLPAKFSHIVTDTKPLNLAKTGWRDLPGMTATVETGEGRFLILFQASGVQSAHTNNAVGFRLMVGERVVATARHEFATVGWALRNVNLQALEQLEAGTHTIRVQWAGGYDGKTIQLSRYKDTRSLIIVEQ